MHWKEDSMMETARMETARVSAILALGAAIASSATGAACRELDEPGTDVDAESLIASTDFTRGGAFEGSSSIPRSDRVGISMTAGQVTRIETRNCTPGTDPVMHLFRWDGTFTQVARDDDSGGALMSLINYTPPSSDTYYVHTRPYAQASIGACDIYVNQVFLFRVNVGGSFVTLSNLRTGEVLESNPLPGDRCQHTHQIFLFAPNGMDIERISPDQGTACGCRMTLSSALGTRKLLVSATPDIPQYRLIRNDAALGDRDGDGLGDELEAAIGTCSDRRSKAGGFSCGWVADPRDTDGDGLPDAWEVLGKRDMAPHQPLSAWGADPRHKDAFFEMDFGQRTAGDVRPNMGEAFWRRVVDVFAAQQPALLDDAEIAKNARWLRNPDGQPGVRIHMDNGLTPTQAADLTRWGNWGGYNVVPPGGNADVSWVTQMSPARRGVFRYVLAWDGGGSACPEFSTPCNAPLGSIFIHEIGHTFRLGHSGPSYGDIADPNCKPNYYSVMNYAHRADAAGGFNHGRIGPLDNRALSEVNLVFNDPTFFTRMHDVYGYNVDPAGHMVDWNRDGEFQSTPVTSYVNYAPHESCEWTRYNSVAIATASSPVLDLTDPALVRASGNLYALYLQGGALRYSYAHHSGNCPDLDYHCNGLDALWTAGAQLGTGLTAIDAATIVGTSPVVLIVGTQTTGALVEYRASIATTGALQLTAGPLPIGSSALGMPSLLVAPDGTITLAYKASDGRLRTRQRSGATWTAESMATLRDGTAIPVLPAAMSPELAWFQLPWDSVTNPNGCPTGPGLYAFVGDATHGVQVHRRQPDGLWCTVLPLDTSFPAVHGKVHVAWTPANTATGRAERTYLYFTQGDGLLKIAMSYGLRVALSPSGHRVDVRIGLLSDFDNPWATLPNGDVMFDASIDSNVHHLAIDSLRGLGYRPNVDGMTGHVLPGLNDWEAIGSDLCRKITDPGAWGGDFPVKSLTCPAWKYDPGRYGDDLHLRLQPEYCAARWNNDWQTANHIGTALCDTKPVAMTQWMWERSTGYIRGYEPAGREMCWRKTVAGWSDQRLEIGPCGELGADAKAWGYEDDTGLITARLNPSKCVVNVPGSPDLGLRDCSAAADVDRRWSF
jgi:hypothetical protein